LLHHDQKPRRSKRTRGASASESNKIKEGGEGRKRSSSKNFTSDLDSLFEDALKETVLEKVEKIKEKTLGSDTKTARRKRASTVALTGIDALIRKTGNLEASELIPTKKRVSFAFDRHKFQKLKNIAKEEKMYLKDIIGDVVSDFIKEYESKNNIEGA